MENNFVRVQSVKDITIYTSLIILGLLLSFLPGSQELNFGGYTIVVIGVITAFLLKSAYKDTRTNEKYSRKGIFFSIDKKASILSAMDTTLQSISLADNGNGQGLRLEIYHNKALGKAHVQLFEYIPYRYESCTEMRSYEFQEVEALLK